MANLVVLTALSAFANSFLPVKTVAVAAASKGGPGAAVLLGVAPLVGSLLGGLVARIAPWIQRRDDEDEEVKATRRHQRRRRRPFRKGVVVDDYMYDEQKLLAVSPLGAGVAAAAFGVLGVLATSILLILGLVALGARSTTLRVAVWRLLFDQDQDAKAIEGCHSWDVDGNDLLTASPGSSGSVDSDAVHGERIERLRAELRETRDVSMSRDAEIELLRSEVSECDRSIDRSIGDHSGAVLFVFCTFQYPSYLSRYLINGHARDRSTKKPNPQVASLRSQSRIRSSSCHRPSSLSERGTDSETPGSSKSSSIDLCEH